MRADENEASAGRRHMPQDAVVELPGGWRGALLARSEKGRGFQGVYLVEADGAKYVYKVYGPRRLPLGGWPDRLAAWAEGRSCGDPRTRCLMERRAMTAWRQEGFAVFPIADSAPKIPFDAPVLVTEYVPGRTALKRFADPAVPRAEKLQDIAALAGEWARRHTLARDLRDPLLVHEHPALVHIWRGDDGRFYHFDFESIFIRRRAVERLIAREILGFVRSLLKSVPQTDQDDFLDAVLLNYARPEFLRLAWADLWRSPNPFVRAYRFIERRARRNRGPFSRFAVAERIVRRLRQG